MSNNTNELEQLFNTVLETMFQEQGAWSLF